MRVVAALLWMAFVLYGMFSAMFDVKDWLGRKYNDNPPYWMRLLHIITFVTIAMIMFNAMV